MYSMLAAFDQLNGLVCTGTSLPLCTCLGVMIHSQTLCDTAYSFCGMHVSQYIATQCGTLS